MKMATPETVSSSCYSVIARCTLVERPMGSVDSASVLLTQVGGRVGGVLWGWEGSCGVWKFCYQCAADPGAPWPLLYAVASTPGPLTFVSLSSWMAWFPMTTWHRIDIEPT